MEAGLKHLGSAGLTSDRWGDVPAWQPAEKKELQRAGRMTLMPAWKHGKRRRFIIAFIPV